MRPDLLSALNVARRDRRAAVLVTEIPGGAQRLVTPDTLAADPLHEAIDAALRSGRLRWLLRRELEALCRARAPRSTFAWLEPPRSAAEEPLQPLPLWEERHLLSHPAAVKRAEKTLLGLPLSPEDFDDKPLPPAPVGP